MAHPPPPPPSVLKRPRSDEEPQRNEEAKRARTDARPAAIEPQLSNVNQVPPLHTDNSVLVKDFYNSLAREGHTREDRKSSAIADLRSFNNWIKSCLIREYLREGDVVLDICGGKGGDLPKWNVGKISRLVLADLSDASVKEAISRFNELKGGRPPFPANFICANCFKSGLGRELDRLNYSFDLVSCQFSLHYSFESRALALGFFRNVASHLRPGGHFVATLPCANRIRDRLVKSGGSKRFGNPFYHVEFEHTDSFPAFGSKYTFYLEDAVGAVPEYLVYTETLRDLAREVGLKPVLSQHFEVFYKAQKDLPESKELLLKLRHGRSEEMTEELWEIAKLYDVVVFEKEGADPNAPPPRREVPRGDFEFDLADMVNIID